MDQRRALRSPSSNGRSQSDPAFFALDPSSTAEEQAAAFPAPTPGDGSNNTPPPSPRPRAQSTPTSDRERLIASAAVENVHQRHQHQHQQASRAARSRRNKKWWRRLLILFRAFRLPSSGGSSSSRSGSPSASASPSPSSSPVQPSPLVSQKFEVPAAAPALPTPPQPQPQPLPQPQPQPVVAAPAVRITLDADGEKPVEYDAFTIERAHLLFPRRPDTAVDLQTIDRRRRVRRKSDLVVAASAPTPSPLPAAAEEDERAAEEAAMVNTVVDHEEDHEALPPVPKPRGSWSSQGSLDALSRASSRAASMDAELRSSFDLALLPPSQEDGDEFNVTYHPDDDEDDVQNDDKDVVVVTLEGDHPTTPLRQSDSGVSVVTDDGDAEKMAHVAVAPPPVLHITLDADGDTPFEYQAFTIERAHKLFPRRKEMADDKATLDRRRRVRRKSDLTTRPTTTEGAPSASPSLSLAQG
ncbi:hypothetical protein BC828DRAFT_373686 [Blastocladiella britannica]|nr:hypothetical protein BC828DRAFT_373686 [Blastocladiella britannica]